MAVRRALVTRPREDAGGVAQALAARGYAVMVEPLLTIRPRPDTPLSTDGVQAVLATSANGIRALAERWPERNVRVLTVGERSAEVARDLGYGDVTSAAGDVHALAALTKKLLDPADGALLHPAGTEVAGDLAALLPDYALRRACLYQAVTTDDLSPELIAALRGNVLDVSFFFSPRTAATFVRLIERAGLADHCGAIAAYAISANAAEPLARLPWRRLRAATQPDQASLLALLDRDDAAAAQDGRGDREEMGEA